MADTIIFTPQRGWTLNGDVLPGGKALFYQTGTSTPVVVYSDAALSAILSQPVLADSNGVFPQVYFDGATNVRAVVRSSDDVEVSDIDPVATVALSSSGAGGITFTPSVNLPASNVQDAVDLSDTNWRAATAAQQAELDGLGTASLMDDSADTDLSNDPDAAARRDIVKAAIDANGPLIRLGALGVSPFTIYNNVGVDSFTRNSVGEYSVEFSEDMPDTNYLPFVSGLTDTTLGTESVQAICEVVTKRVDGCDIVCARPGDAGEPAVLYDLEDLRLIIWA